MQPVPVPRSSRRERAAAQALPREMSERRLDQGLGIGAGVERMRIEVEFAAVELAGSGDPRHGLAFEAPRDGGAKRFACLRPKGVPGLRGIGLVGQAGGVAEQQPRIELGRLDPRLAQGASRFDEGLVQGQGLRHGPPPAWRRAGWSDAR